MLIIGEDDGKVYAVTFSPNGEYLWDVADKAVRMWRVTDGKQMARMEVERGRCLAVSKDEKWIAAGMKDEGVVVWNAKTYERAFLDMEGCDNVDFSPNSVRLVSTKEWAGAIIWDVASGKQVQTLYYEDTRGSGVKMFAAKYSPQGDRIVTASRYFVQVWDSNDGRLLLKIDIHYSLSYNKGLHWRNDHLFVVSDRRIQQINASTGSKISEWPVSDDDCRLCTMALPQHGGFIAYSTEHTVTLWDTATRTQLSLTQYPHGIGSFAFSPDNRFFATGSRGPRGKITIQSLPHVAASICLI